MAKLTEAITLTAATIGDQDQGTAALLIDSEIQKAMNDLADRGEEDGKQRKVTIELELFVSNGLVITNVSAIAKIPPRRTRSTKGDLRMKEKGNYVLLFQSTNPERADQPTFEE